MKTGTGRVSIVTGAGRGLGEAYARALAARGDAVVVNDLGVDEGVARADVVVDDIRAQGGRAHASTVDLSSRTGPESLVEDAVETFGRLDALVNNAGILRPAAIERVTDDELDLLLAIHLAAGIRGARAAWPHLVSSGSGRIVFTGSSASFGHAGNSVYAAAKSGILGLTRSLAAEGRGRGLLVNAVWPVARSAMGRENPIVDHAEPDVAPLLHDLDRDGRRDPRTPAALVAHLTSMDCSVSGESYSVAAGRFGRVVLGVTQGWQAPAPDLVVEDEVAAAMDEIRSGGVAMEPESMADELRLLG